MSKAKKRLSKFSFEDEGAAVALVGKHQGGPANGVTTLITKSTSDITDEALEKALEEPEKDSTSSVEGDFKVALEGENVVTKAEDGKPTNEEVQMTQEEIQEMINKAAGELADSRVAEVEKAYKAEVEATNKELQVLKAAHETRTAQEYLTKATEYAQFLGEDADKEAIAKALRAVEGIEEAAPLMQVLKALKDVAAKDDLLEEVGKSATKEQPSDFDSQVIAVAKSLKESDPNLTQRQAEMKAHEQIVSQS